MICGIYINQVEARRANRSLVSWPRDGAKLIVECGSLVGYCPFNRNTFVQEKLSRMRPRNIYDLLGQE